MSYLPTRMKSSNIKAEISIDDHVRHRLVRHGLSLQAIPEGMKSVEVSCLNKVYHGVGLRNDNGGLEYFSEDFSRKAVGSVRHAVESFLRELVSLKHRLSKVEDEISRVGGTIETDTLRFVDVEKQLDGISDRLEALREGYRSGKVNDRQYHRTIYNIRREGKQAAGSVRALTARIDSYHQCLRERPVLLLRIEALRGKICEFSAMLKVLPTVSIERSGLLFFPRYEGVRSRQVCLFGNFLDYLAYRTLVSSDGSDPHGLVLCDAIVMNSPVNFVDMLLDSDLYEGITCFFPATVSGLTMEATVLSRNPRAESRRDLYEEVGSLYGMLGKSE